MCDLGISQSRLKLACSLLLSVPCSHNSVTLHHGTQAGPTEEDRAKFAIDKYAYYLCFKCKHAYFGGLRACQDARGDDFNPEELVCPMCVQGTHGRRVERELVGGSGEGEVLGVEGREWTRA